MSDAPVPATVLVVDDDEMVRNVMWFILSRDGCDVLVAADGNAAVRVARHHRGPIHLLLADVELPSARGPEVWRRLAADRPGLPALFVSGNVSALDGSTPPPDGFHILRKPFTPSALMARAWEIMDRAAEVPTIPMAVC